MIPTSSLDRRSFIDVENFSDGVTGFFRDNCTGKFLPNAG